jgi:hypothetical protein
MCMLSILTLFSFTFSLLFISLYLPFSLCLFLFTSVKVSLFYQLDLPIVSFYISFLSLFISSSLRLVGDFARDGIRR